MAKFHGKVGYGHNQETSPGVHKDVIVEREYFGEVVRNSLQQREAEKVNLDHSVSHSISIVADAYATEHVFDIRYVEWAGKLWTVRSTEIERPRLILGIGEVYNGPTA